MGQFLQPVGHPSPSLRKPSAASSTPRPQGAADARPVSSLSPGPRQTQSSSGLVAVAACPPLPGPLAHAGRRHQQRVGAASRYRFSGRAGRCWALGDRLLAARELPTPRPRHGCSRG